MEINSYPVSNVKKSEFVNLTDNSKENQQNIENSAYKNLVGYDVAARYQYTTPLHFCGGKPVDYDKMDELLKKGYTVNEIAKELNCSNFAIYAYKNKKNQISKLTVNDKNNKTEFSRKVKNTPELSAENKDTGKQNFDVIQRKIAADVSNILKIIFDGINEIQNEYEKQEINPKTDKKTEESLNNNKSETSEITSSGDKISQKEVKNKTKTTKNKDTQIKKTSHKYDTQISKHDKTTCGQKESGLEIITDNPQKTIGELISEKSKEYKNYSAKDFSDKLADIILENDDLFRKDHNLYNFICFCSDKAEYFDKNDLVSLTAMLDLTANGKMSLQQFTKYSEYNVVSDKYLPYHYENYLKTLATKKQLYPISEKLSKIDKSFFENPEKRAVIKTVIADKTAESHSHNDLVKFENYLFYYNAVLHESMLIEAAKKFSYDKTKSVKPEIAGEFIKNCEKYLKNFNEYKTSGYKSLSDKTVPEEFYAMIDKNNFNPDEIMLSLSTLTSYFLSPESNNNSLNTFELHLNNNLSNFKESIITNIKNTFIDAVYIKNDTSVMIINKNKVAILAKNVKEEIKKSGVDRSQLLFERFENAMTHTVPPVGKAGIKTLNGAEAKNFDKELKIKGDSMTPRVLSHKGDEYYFDYYIPGHKSCIK